MTNPVPDEGFSLQPAPAGQRPLSAQELAEAHRPGGPNDKCRIRGQVVVVLRNEQTGKKTVHVTHNIVTNEGDKYYAARGAAGSPSFSVAGLRLGSHAGTPTTPLKTDVKMQTTTGSSPVASSVKAIDATYPKVSDPDPDNPSAGAAIITWRVSYLVSEANSANIATMDLPDSLVDGSITKSLAIANFSSKFEKTSLDTLKIFVNHSFLGI